MATPVISADAAETIEDSGMELVAVKTVENLFSIGAWYENFDEVENSDVIRLLRINAHKFPSPNAQ